MLYSRSAEYAIRAFVHLASVPAGRYVLVRDIATRTGVPAPFLAKILQQLARRGLLRSSKGPTGGFSLREPSSQISLLRIVSAVDGLGGYERCITGLSECTDHAACGMHDSWKTLRSRIMDYLEGTSVDAVARAQEQKRREQNRSRRPGRNAGR